LLLLTGVTFSATLTMLGINLEYPVFPTDLGNLMQPYRCPPAGVSNDSIT
jgi:hypothetical protein